MIAGTAGAVRHAQNQHWANQEAQQQGAYNQAYQQGAYDAQQQQQPQYYAPPPQQYAPPPQAPAQDDLTTKLQELAQLHSSGVLTDEEFTAAKQKLLAS